MTDRTCERCGKIFKLPCRLKEHQARKNPCKTDIEKSAKTYSCRKCGDMFTDLSNMYRHMRTRCQGKNSADLTDLADEDAKKHTLEEKVDSLTALVKQIATSAPVQSAGTTTNQVVSGTIQSGNITNNITQNITFRPWTSTVDRIMITASLIETAFTENERLAEYCRLTDAQRVDPELAVPYVLEALVDLVKRAHAADPASQNLHLNPRRADQVVVYDEAGRRIITLVEAIRGLFDSVSGRIHRIIVTEAECKKLPFEIQASASWIPRMYETAPDTYVAKAKGPLAAHLSNPTVLTGLPQGTQLTFMPPTPPTPAATIAAPKPPRPKPASEVRWSFQDAAEQLAAIKRNPDEPLTDWAARLVAAARIEHGRWCNKLWEALDEGLFAGPAREEASALLAAAEAAPS